MPAKTTSRRRRPQRTEIRSPASHRAPPIDQRRAEELVTQLMAIPGASGHESLVASAIERELRKAGVPSSAMRRDRAQKKSPFGGDTGSVVVKLPGTVRGPRRLLMAHMDTVPICVGSKPVRKGRRIHSGNPGSGLGGDNRSGVAAVLVAALEILDRKLSHPPLTLFFPIQEEVGLIGARFASLSSLGNPRLAFNFDGGSPSQVVIGATGAFRLTIDVEGVASHAGVHPEAGVSAIAIQALAIAELHAGGWHGLVRKGRKQGTSNVGVVHGGDATNVVTERVRLRAEARSHDGAFRRRIVSAYRQAFTRAAKSVRNTTGRAGKVSFDVHEDYESFTLAKSEPCVQAAVEAVREAGCEPSYRVVNGGLDANWMNTHGIPTVTLGSGQKDIHTVEESLDLSEFLSACQVALSLAAAAT